MGQNPTTRCTLQMVLPPNDISTSSSSSSSCWHSVINLSTAQNLVKAGRKPSLRSLNLLLLSLLRSGRPPILLGVFAQIVSNSLPVRPRAHFLAARALLASRRFEEAERFIARAEEDFGFPPKASLFDSLIVGVCVEEGNASKGLALLRECVEKRRLFASRRTLRSLVEAFCGRGEMKRAVEAVDIVSGGTDGMLVGNFVCSSVVSGFSKIGKPELGLEFYARMAKAPAFQPNLITYTTVVDAFCRAGRISEACNMVRKMEEDGLVPDAILYSCWICGYFKQGDVMEGLRKHKLMVEKGISPDVVNYTNVIDGLCREGSVEKVIGLLDEMKKKGVKPNLVTYTAVIRGFCKRNKLEEAFSVFRKVEELGVIADEFVYSILIYGFSSQGNLDRVFTLLEEMEKKEIKVGCVTYNTVINGLCKAGKVDKAEEMSKGFVSDNFTYSTLLHGYTKEINVEGALQVKRRLDEAGINMDIVTCNVLIKAFLLADMVDDARQLFEQLPSMGLVANCITYSTIIDGYCKLGFIEKALETFEEYKRTSSITNAVAHNCLIKGLCKEHMTNMATIVFEDLVGEKLVADPITYRMLIRTLYKEASEEGILKFIQRIETLEPQLISSICNDVISFLCARGCYVSALDVYMLLRKRNFAITSKSYYSLLKGLIRCGYKQVLELIINECIKVHGIFQPQIINVTFLYLCKKNVEQAIQFFSRIGSRKISLSALTAVVDALKKEGRAEDAYKYLLQAQDNNLTMDVVVYALVVDGLCKAGHLEKALDLCASMRTKGVEPNVIIFNSVINGLCQQGCLTEAFRILDFLENHLSPNIATYSILIGYLSREGLLQDANHVFNRMVTRGINPNANIYNKLINGYCSFGLVEESLKYLLDMDKYGLAPEAFTVSAVISGYCQRGDIEGALGFFNEYRGRDHSPDFLGYMHLVKGFFTKGRMEEARSIMRDMLQCMEIASLINEVGYELHGETLVSLISLACEEGRIKEAILVLNEVGYLSFPSWRINNENRFKVLKKLQSSGVLDAESEKIDAGAPICPTLTDVPENMHDLSMSVYLTTGLANVNDSLTKKTEDHSMDTFKCSTGKTPEYDFDTYYSMITWLCSRGDMQKAKNLVKAMIQNSEKVHNSTL